MVKPRLAAIIARLEFPGLRLTLTTAAAMDFLILFMG